VKIPLDKSGDTHLVLFEQYMGNTANIIVRVLLDCLFTESQHIDSLDALVKKHPYLYAKVCRGAEKNGTPNYYLEPILNGHLSYQITNANKNEIQTIFTSLSDRRYYHFDYPSGELAHVQIWQDDHQSLIELSCGHLVGEVESLLILLSDYLDFLNTSITSKPISNKRCSRLGFDIRRFGWNVKRKIIEPLKKPDASQLNSEPWPTPEFDFQRFSMPASRFKQISNWLTNNHITAKPFDVFYYIAACIFWRTLNREFNFWIIFSYRQLIKNPEKRNNIKSEAAFYPITINADNLNNANVWIENFQQIRKKALSMDNIIAKDDSIQALNKTIIDKPQLEGRQLLNAYIHMPEFAFNNYGKIDQFFGERTNFSVKDVDIQDGIPAQEVRMFGLGDEIKITPMFYKNTSLSPLAFWEMFNRELDKLMGDK